MFIIQKFIDNVYVGVSNQIDKDPNGSKDVVHALVTRQVSVQCELTEKRLRRIG